MIIKKKLKKEDVLQGIEIKNEKDDLEKPIQKKVVLEADKTILQEKYKAGYTLQNQNNAAVEKEIYETKVNINPITEMIQRLKSVNNIEDLKNGKIPKKNIVMSKANIMPSNVKFSYNVDYNPMLCKDYHDTGYCTFGDSCIYIHDRGDYKAGWEIEKEYQDNLKRKQQGSNQDEEQQQLDQLDIPELCSICNNRFIRPVFTQCNHIFCEKCIIKQKRCPQCNKFTNGIFNNATKYLKELDEKRIKLIESQLNNNNNNNNND